MKSRKEILKKLTEIYIFRRAIDSGRVKATGDIAGCNSGWKQALVWVLDVHAPDKIRGTDEGSEGTGSGPSETKAKTPLPECPKCGKLIVPEGEQVHPDHYDVVCYCVEPESQRAVNEPES